MDIASYSSDSRAIIKNAREVASAFRHPEIEIEHLLMAAVRYEGTEVESILNDLGKTPSFVESIVEIHLKEQSSRTSTKENLNISPSVQKVLEQSIEEKSRLYDPLVEPEHILLAIFDPKSALSPYVREKLGVTKEDIYKSLAESKAVEEIATGKPSERKDTAEGGEPSREKKGIAKTLRYCIDMTNIAAGGEYDPMIGREDELQQVIQILLRRRKNSPVLVGGAGVGKSAIVEGFAQAVIDETVPKSLRGVKVMEVDMGALVAGAKYKGEFEERFKSLVSEVVKSGGKIILFIDEIHTLAGAGSGGGMDAANLIKPALARGQIRLIGATTQEEYTRYLEKDKALDRRFERVVVEEPNYDDTLRIMTGVVQKYADHHKITYSPEALSAAVKFSQRYLSERNLPDVALDVIDEAASEFAVKKEFGEDKKAYLEKQFSEIEKMIKNLEGKDPDKDREEIEEFNKAYDEFSRQINALNKYWGHRVEALTEVGHE